MKRQAFRCGVSISEIQGQDKCSTGLLPAGDAPEPDVLAPFSGIELAANGGAKAVLINLPRTAPQNTFFSACWACRIVDRCISIGSIPIRPPFPHVPRHVQLVGCAEAHHRDIIDQNGTFSRSWRALYGNASQETQRKPMSSSQTPGVPLMRWVERQLNSS